MTSPSSLANLSLAVKLYQVSQADAIDELALSYPLKALSHTETWDPLPLMSYPTQGPQNPEVMDRSCPSEVEL